MKTALYMRVSKSDGSQTVENQRRDLRAYAKRMGYDVVELIDHETGSRSDAEVRGQLFELGRKRRLSSAKAERTSDGGHAR